MRLHSRVYVAPPRPRAAAEGMGAARAHYSPFSRFFQEKITAAVGEKHRGRTTFRLKMGNICRFFPVSRLFRREEESPRQRERDLSICCFPKNRRRFCRISTFSTEFCTAGKSSGKAAGGGRKADACPAADGVIPAPGTWPARRPWTRSARWRAPPPAWSGRRILFR